jgi:type III secretory pathway component EscV
VVFWSSRCAVRGYRQRLGGVAEVPPALSRCHAGRQMSIDAELRSGHITHETARLQRQSLPAKASCTAP